jgi:hypothetical protein
LSEVYSGGDDPKVFRRLSDRRWKRLRRRRHNPDGGSTGIGVDVAHAVRGRRVSTNLIAATLLAGFVIPWSGCECAGVRVGECVSFALHKGPCR